MAYGVVRFGLALAFVAAAVAATPARAVTINDGMQLPSGISLDLASATTCGNSGNYTTNVGSFAGSGQPGSGGSSCGDKTTVQVKDASTPFPFGRYAPAGGKWVDSNDLANVSWQLNVGVGLTGVSFALVDAHDQPNSHFSISVNGASWSIPTREANGNLHWIAILFDTPVTTATINFSTRLNDGYGISDVKVAPVPLPAGLALMASSLLLLGALRLRRRPAA